jgi:hypothetical protein
MLKLGLKLLQKLSQRYVKQMLYVSVVKMDKLRETSFMMASPRVEIWARDVREMKQALDCELPHTLVAQYSQ